MVRGDALDRDYWERVRFHPEVELVIAAMSSHGANLECVRRIREFLPSMRIAAIATFADQIDEPMLLIHGAEDANPGTRTYQSEILFEAVRGAGLGAAIQRGPLEGLVDQALGRVVAVIWPPSEWRTVPSQSSVTE